MRTSIRVRGVTYASPDEARVAAEEIEHNADAVAAGLRARGKEGEADTVQDRGHADAERLRAFARERESAEAASTAQPAGAPRSARRTPSTSTSSRASSRTSTRSSSSSRTRAVQGGGRRGGRGRRDAATRPRSARSPIRRFADTGYRRSGGAAAVSSWGSLAWQAAGLTVLVALVTLFLSPRGVTAFADLANGAAGLLALVVEPVDPLAPRGGGDFGRGGSFGGGDFTTPTTPARPPTPGTVTVPGTAPSPIPGAIPGAGGRLTPPARSTPANRRPVRSVVVRP